MKVNNEELGSEFVCYSLPGSSDYYYCEIESIFLSEDFDHITEYDFVIAPFNRTSKSSLFIKFSSREINTAFKCISYDSNSESETSQDDYRRCFNKFKSEILDKRLDKVVCSRIKNVRRDHCEIPQLYKNLVDKYKEAFVFLWNTRDHGTWMGATPELLLKSENERLKTVALAGTKALKENIEEIEWTAKEKQEQQIIVDYLIEQFKQNNIEHNISETYPVRAGKMCHLKTDIYFDKYIEINKLLNIIHPGPAISGYPVNDAIRLIEDTEKHDREFYTGFLGLVEKEQMKLFVNLRSMKLTADNFSLYLGGGLTIDSDLEEEWKETELKSKTLLSVIKKSKSLNDLSQAKY